MTFLGNIPSPEDKAAFEQWRRDAILFALAEQAERSNRTENWLYGLLLAVVTAAAIPVAEIIEWSNVAGAVDAPVLAISQLGVAAFVLFAIYRQWRQLQRDRDSDTKLVGILRGGGARAGQASA